ncbi:protein of unknown function [Maribacter sedimenticola]|uniref:DUF4301 domain-containing protein n=1 Tax=Maribacter sedimenticola TaxID=228956 RepID=A0ABY1SJ03_9FLAO|nr:DUF4301 family protein [Maribacter sedimenticola]SNR56446.1 protein of unknown function [Maribacter sedimenticola]
MIQFTENDEKQLKEKGIAKEKVMEQINTFKEGIPFVNLRNAAIIGNGILKFSPSEENELIKLYEHKLTNLEVLKFVPASGAASRMFKALFNFLDVYDPAKETLKDYLGRTGDKDIKIFSEGMERLPFYDLVISRLPNKNGTEGEVVYHFVTELLGENALNYGFYPKGLLPFHNYNGTTATPFEEHLKEGALYAGANGKAKLHFTVSGQHEEMFKEEFAKVGPRVSNDTGLQYEIDYSFQKPSTDTLAVDMENKPFRNPDGTVLFRPGGHGALIENLNDQDADIIFIKNIDNVAVMKDAKEVADSKKVLAGTLLKVQEKAFEYAKQIEERQLTENEIEEISSFLRDELNVRFNEDFSTISMNEQIAVLRDKINRPIRIAGMVKNEGEPGGGPFWVTNANGEVSLQIIESAQINMDDNQQADIMRNSTHFNPVDLVCGVRNFKGEKYNLLKFVDDKQGFITGKTKDGKELKALELPGLWNGAMAFWNTIFVEVPLVTFNPVKSVVDLLKESHQV